MHGRLIRPFAIIGGLLGAAPTSGQPVVEPRQIMPFAVRCGVADLRGAYGFFRTGVNPQGAIAAVGVGHFDADGKMVTVQSTNRAGTVTQGSFPGTYEVTDDCRGIWYDERGAAIAHFVLVDGGNEFFFLSLSPGNTITGHGKRISPISR